MRRATKIIVVVYLIRGNGSQRIIWHLAVMRPRCEIYWMEDASRDFLLFIGPQIVFQTDCLLFGVEYGILLVKLYILFALVHPFEGEHDFG